MEQIEMLSEQLPEASLVKLYVSYLKLRNWKM